MSVASGKGQPWRSLALVKGDSSRPVQAFVPAANILLAKVSSTPLYGYLLRTRVQLGHLRSLVPHTGSLFAAHEDSMLESVWSSRIVKDLGDERKVALHERPCQSSKRGGGG